jgi:hypothetical protein
MVPTMTREQLKEAIDKLLDDHAESKHIEPFSDRNATLEALLDLIDEETNQAFQRGVYAGQESVG